MPNMQGIMFSDGQTIQRSDDDECEVQNNVDACTNYLLHDQLRSGWLLLLTDFQPVICPRIFRKLTS